MCYSHVFQMAIDNGDRWWQAVCIFSLKVHWLLFVKIVVSMASYPDFPFSCSLFCVAYMLRWAVCSCSCLSACIIYANYCTKILFASTTLSCSIFALIAYHFCIFRQEQTSKSYIQYNLFFCKLLKLVIHVTSSCLFIVSFIGYCLC